MAIQTSSTGSVRSDINITPLVDVVLVLLIIFMIVTPILQMGHEVQVPPKLETNVPPPTTDDQVIVRLDSQGRAFINKLQVTRNEFPTRLREVLAGRSAKVVFFAADGELPYGDVADFMDMVRDNGAQNLGIVFDDMKGAAGAAKAAAPAAP